MFKAIFTLLNEEILTLLKEKIVLMAYIYNVVEQNLLLY